MQLGNEICRQWLRGRHGCQHGLSCIYSHQKVPQVCHDWMNGKCKFTDERCAYVHNENVTNGLALWSDGTRCVRISSQNTGCHDFRDQINSQLATMITDKHGETLSPDIQIAMERLLDKLVQLDIDSVRSILADRKRVLNMAGILQTSKDALKGDNNGNACISEMKVEHQELVLQQLCEKMKNEESDLNLQNILLADALNDVSSTETVLSEYTQKITDMKRQLEVQQAHLDCVQKKFDTAKKSYNATMREIVKQNLLLEQTRARVNMQVEFDSEKKKREDGNLLCAICLSEEPRWVFVPCGHHAIPVIPTSRKTTSTV